MVGKRLKELRNAKGLSQQALADELSISKDAVSQYEREIISPGDDTKIKLAKYFNVSIDYLLGLTDTIEPLKRQKPTLPREFEPEWLSELELCAQFLVYYHKFSDEEKTFIETWSNLRKDKRDAFIRFIKQD